MSSSILISFAPNKSPDTIPIPAGIRIAHAGKKVALSDKAEIAVITVLYMPKISIVREPLIPGIIIAIAAINPPKKSLIASGTVKAGKIWLSFAAACICGEVPEKAMIKTKPSIMQTI